MSNLSGAAARPSPERTTARTLLIRSRDKKVQVRRQDPSVNQEQEEPLCNLDLCHVSVIIRYESEAQGDLMKQHFNLRPF